MNPGELLEYLDKIIKPAVEEYARERNINVEELLLECITLENTGLFNYKGRKSTVYNRLKNNHITNLKQLFDLYYEQLCKNRKNEDIFKIYLNEMDDLYIKNNSNARIVIDYISGMTDDFFNYQYNKYFKKS